MSLYNKNKYYKKHNIDKKIIIWNQPYHQSHPKTHKPSTVSNPPLSISSSLRSLTSDRISLWRKWTLLLIWLIFIIRYRRTGLSLPCCWLCCGESRCIGCGWSCMLRGRSRWSWICSGSILWCLWNPRPPLQHLKD